jgi:hypothetical protein
MKIRVSLITPDWGLLSAQYKCMTCESTSPRIEFSGGTSNEKIIERLQAVSSRRVEPKNRVLTLEEVDAHCEGGADAAPLWVEFDGGTNGWVLIAPVRETCKMDFVSKLLATMGILYGKEWRCWLRKPTEAERQETPWEGEKP